MIKLPMEFGETWINPQSVALIEANNFINHSEPAGATSGEICLLMNCGYRISRYVFNNAAEVLKSLKITLGIIDETQPATPLDATAETGS